jgi:hypothetical protein
MSEILAYALQKQFCQPLGISWHTGPEKFRINGS